MIADLKSVLSLDNRLCLQGFVEFLVQHQEHVGEGSGETRRDGLFIHDIACSHRHDQLLQAVAAQTPRVEANKTDKRQQW